MNEKAKHQAIYINKIYKILFSIKKNLTYIGKKCFYLLLIIFVVILLRVFVFEFYIIDSCSMENTLFAGDIIWVDKLQYGARYPMKPKDVPYLEVIAYIMGFKSWIRNAQWKYRRMPGTNEIKRNDIIVFANTQKDEYTIKRCVGLPGDTFMIKHVKRYANNILQPEVSTVKYSFNVKSPDGYLPEDTLRSYGLSTKSLLWQKADNLHLNMTDANATALVNCSLVDTIFYDEMPGIRDTLLFPFSEHYVFSQENYGPIVIPSKNLTIQIDSINIALYKDIIVRYENNKLNVNKGDIFINGEKRNTYTFRLNYFFMTGDNQHRSFDSRFWGFVPESSIIGKLGFILLSFDSEKESLKKIRVNRLFKKVK